MTISSRSITFSMLAVGFALGTAFILPAAVGAPTGQNLTVAVNQQTDALYASRQGRIQIARDMRHQRTTVMAQTKQNPAM